MISGTAGRTAIACVSRLAESYDGGRTTLTADRIAEDRQLKTPFVRKVMSTLARVGLASSATGPGGGFCLTRPPATITLREVLEPFERVPQETECPFGGGICGRGDPCPLHERTARLRAEIERFLSETTFAPFAPDAASAPDDDSAGPAS